MDVKQVARELGVRYVVEGSVRRSGGRARVTAQLIDAETGNHVWAERYYCDVSEIFAVQYWITDEVTTSILPAVTDAEQRRALRKPPQSLGAWEAYQRGLWHVIRMDTADNKQARLFFQRAIDLDFAFSLPYQGLARTYLDETSHHMTRNAADAFGLALPLALKAVELDLSDANAHGLLGYVWLINGDPEQGLARAKMGLIVTPNSTVALQTKGSCLVLLGLYEEGTHVLREYLRLSPRDPWSFRAYTHLSIARYALSDYQGCVDFNLRALQVSPKFNAPYGGLRQLWPNLAGPTRRRGLFVKQRTFWHPCRLMNIFFIVVLGSRRSNMSACSIACGRWVGGASPLSNARLILKLSGHLNPSHSRSLADAG